MQLYYYIFNDNEPVIIGGKMLSFDEKNYNTVFLEKEQKTILNMYILKQEKRYPIKI